MTAPAPCFDRRQIPLSSSWFIVIFSNGQWWVDHEGKPCGPYASAAEASEGAVRLARHIGDGREWEVFAPGADNRHVLVAARRDEPTARDNLPNPADGS